MLSHAHASAGPEGIGASGQNPSTIVSSEQIEEAARALDRGALVAFPTETVYGLGADASSPEAVASIYAAKGRPSNHPVIVHVADQEQASRWVEHLPEQAKALMQAFWPGPLTLILKRAPWVDTCVSGGQDTIGIRCPSHPVAHALLRAFARLRGQRPAGVAAPSANRFGHVSPTTADHVREEFSELVNQGMPVLEGGASEIGIESTIVDLSRLDQGHPPALLRPGGVLAADIERVLGVPLSGHDQHAPRVSGALKAHYAPRTKLRLLSADRLPDEVLLWVRDNPGRRLAVVATNALFSGSVHQMVAKQRRAQISTFPMPDDAVSYARYLYASLRDADRSGCDEIFWVDVPNTPAWSGVRDRLQRAAAAFD